MRRAIVLFLGALLLTSCAQTAWKADKSRYPTKAEEEVAFERHNDRCLIKSRVIRAPSETINQPQAARSGHRIVHDNARFNACMEAAGFRLARENTEPAPPAPKEPAEKSDKISEPKDVAAMPPAAPVPDSPPVKAAEPEAAAPPAAPPAEKLPPAVPAAAGVTAADSPYRIQLAAFTTRSRAEKEWARLQATSPGIFGTKELIIVEKELSGRGTFYRVQTGGFDTMQEARSMCATLRAKEQACFSLRKP
jgi:cell division septation protein DedD